MNVKRSVDVTITRADLLAFVRAKLHGGEPVPDHVPIALHVEGDRPECFAHVTDDNPILLTWTAAEHKGI